MKNKILILSVVLLIICFSLIYFSNLTVSLCGKYENKEILFASTSVSVDVADNDCKRELGLSSRTSLGKNQGMLFVYQNDGPRGIWMKDMKFPIDILWINKDMEVVGIEWAITPETYPKIFGEDYKADFVIELPVGFIKENYILLGSKISIK